jgi:endoglucanase
MRRRALLAGILPLGVAYLPACSENDSAGDLGTGAGGTTASGGTGGSVLGGTTATGATATGTTPGSGATASGGTTASGGATASGGTTASGGITASGGVGGGGATSTGGATGGAIGEGGMAATGGTVAAAGSSGSTSGRPSTDKPSTDTTWSQGLTSGGNGPIPFIVVDQFGYRTTATKVAVIRDPQTGYDSAVSFTPGTQYAVIDQATGAIVKQGAPTAWNGGATDDSSGDKAWWFDFSDVTTPGTYTIVDLDNDVRSVEFDIDDDVYRSPLKHAVRMYTYQRAGFAKSAATAGAEWADAASHLGAGQDSEAHAWTAKTDESQVRDLRGGWYDAGDYNKYTAWAAGTVITLLRAYEEHPTAFGDDWGITESGNGLPDFLDEVKWSLDWIVRMQNTDGSLLCILGLAGDSPPSATTGPSYYGPATTNATLMGAAVFAYASKIFGARPEADLQAYAADLSARAVQAWDWAEANPNVLFYNNDESRQPGSSGLGAGQQETDDAGRRFSRFQAAMYLYEMTGEAAYRTFVEANYNEIVASWGPTQWDMEPQDALLYYTRLSGVSSSVSSAILTQFVTNTTNNTDQLPMVTGNQDPYRAPMKDYGWGSNQIKMAQARLYQLLAEYGTGATADTAASAAEEYVHYLHGVNPLGLVYLTNMQRAGAEHSAKTMFHGWFGDQTRWDEVSDTTPGPAPGYLVGGPNPFFELDSCCTATSGDAYQCYGAPEYSLCSQDWEPPMGQPAQKSYLQFNSGWPAGSWSVTEPSTGYQAKYVLVLAAYAR